MQGKYFQYLNHFLAYWAKNSLETNLRIYNIYILYTIIGISWWKLVFCKGECVGGNVLKLMKFKLNLNALALHELLSSFD